MNSRLDLKICLYSSTSWSFRPFVTHSQSRSWPVLSAPTCSLNLYISFLSKRFRKEVLGFGFPSPGNDHNVLRCTHWCLIPLLCNGTAFWDQSLCKCRSCGWCRKWCSAFYGFLFDSSTFGTGFDIHTLPHSLLVSNCRSCSFEVLFFSWTPAFV